MVDTYGVQEGCHPFAESFEAAKRPAAKVRCNLADECGAHGLHSSLDKECAHAYWHKHTTACGGVCPIAITKGLGAATCKERKRES